MSLMLLVLVGQVEGPPLERLGRLGHPALREVSGIVASRRHPGIYWVHNDSGNPTFLFAVRRDGTLVREYAVTIPNIDWEDVAADDQGHLYLGDIGNNGNRLPIRAVYQLDEPDPTGPDEGPLKARSASFYRFPRGGRFDAEGLVIEHGRAVVVAKTFNRREAALYAIPLDPPAPLIRPALPELVGRLPGCTEPVTGADLTPDGRWLAVCSTSGARVYEKDGKGAWALLRAIRFPAEVRDQGIEAICWEGDALILVGEGREMFRIAPDDGRSDHRANRDRAIR